MSARTTKRFLAVVAGIFALGLVAHGAVLLGTNIEPPAINFPSITLEQSSGVCLTCDSSSRVDKAGKSYARMHGGIREVYLEGSPEQIGMAHARLLRDRMVANEKDLWDAFSYWVPWAPFRSFIMDASRVRYRHVDQGFPQARRREIAAQARGFQPDPFANHLATYHRMVFLHSLYDISLSFEHSPLLGCSAFALGPGATTDGHTLLARAFDFEALEIFDADKAVFFVQGDGVIPFASVAWPGLAGVISGMNLEGVAVVVNGARAKEPRATGEPVVLSLRDVLERAHDTGEAVEILRTQSVMVSHIVFVADARGRFAVVERAPGVEAFVREAWPDPNRVGVTNHFEGPLADDPRNAQVRAKTTTLPRRARLDEMLAAVGPHEGSVRRAVDMLRDHACAGALSCSLGDRREIDALIATHGIVADTTDRTLWVSAGPHLSGRFVRFDLRSIFARGYDPNLEPAPELIEQDPILSDGRYAEGLAHAKERGAHP